MFNFFGTDIMVEIKSDEVSDILSQRLGQFARSTEIKPDELLAQSHASSMPQHHLNPQYRKQAENIFLIGLTYINLILQIFIT